MIPAVLSGGSGSRLWPISRSSYPKQFCEIFEEPLLEKTLKRLRALGEPRIVTVKSLQVLTERGMKTLGEDVKNVVYEPFAKNTAPAIALLCWSLLQEKKDQEIVGVFPADHLIAKDEEFLRVVRFAEACARRDQVVTIGIQPDYPATGFGYIECATENFAQDTHLNAKKVLGFREKPDLATAQKFVNEQRYYWNAGMFIFKVETMVRAFEKHLPELWKGIQGLQPDLSNLAEVYEKLPSISLDHGIMEKISEQVCIPCDIGWSDLGSWDDFAKLKSTPRSEVVDVHAENNFVFSLKDKTVGLVGVKDLIVVDTPDALLIAQKGQSQETKTIVDALNQKKSKKTADHAFDFRPWGRYDVISDTEDFKIKVISVNPGAQLSYQSHLHRSEHWVVIEGEGEVIINEQTVEVQPGFSVVIPAHSKHRIKNTGTKHLRFVEVQTGDYFGEDDITRYSDDYKRV